MKVYKKDIKAFVKHKLATSEKWALTCLSYIYNLQTVDERGEIAEDDVTMGFDDYYTDEDDIPTIQLHEGGYAKYADSRGFGKFDADILNKLYQFYKKRDFLSEKQYAIIFKKIPKYWKQFLKHPDIKEEKLHEMVLEWKMSKNAKTKK